MEQPSARPQNDRPGLIGGVVELARNTFGLLMSRIELAALELAEVRANALKLALLFALGVVFAFFAIGYWTVLIAYLSWPVLGWKILLILALVFTVITVGIFFYLKSLIEQGKLSMPATMEELRNDHDALL
ncbi:phage holin family protein [Herminiimonas fonticola]|uniref:phage holin family protein n=1 Tax=Herminiimonas fonticola TaxID=303380 RepID=UPI00334015F4